MVAANTAAASKITTLDRFADHPNRVSPPGEIRSTCVIKIAEAVPAQSDRIAAPNRIFRMLPFDVINHNDAAVPVSESIIANNNQTQKERGTGVAIGAADPEPAGSQCRMR
jgi:hypothetical protein